MKNNAFLLGINYITSTLSLKKTFSIISVITVILTFTFLSGCGFKPVGYTELPKSLKLVYINVSAENKLSTLTAKLVADSGSILVSKAQAEKLVLISPMKNRERLVAMSNNGAIKERERVYYSFVRVIDRESMGLIHSRNIETRRFFQTDDTKKLSSPEREKIVQEAARRELASDILRFLSSLDI